MKLQKLLVAGGFLLCFAQETFADNTFILATGRRDPRMYAIDLQKALRPENNNTPNAIVSRSKVALDRLDAPLDDRGLGVPRGRAAAGRALGLRRGRLGRLLRLGSRRERGADAVARGDGVPAFGDGAGEEGDAEGLEHAARDHGLRSVALRHVPDPLRRPLPIVKTIGVW